MKRIKEKDRIDGDWRDYTYDNLGKSPKCRT